MKSVVCWIKCRMAADLLIGVLTIFTFCGVAAADSGALTVTPSSPVKPGSVLKFKATIIFPLPASYPEVASGTPMKIGVDSDFYGWVTETLTIESVAVGSVTVNFAKTFTVPANAKRGDVFNFGLEWQYKQEGTAVMTYHLAKTSVEVLVDLKELMEKQETGTTSPKIIQKTK